MEEAKSEERAAREFAAGSAVTETYRDWKCATYVTIKATKAATAE